MVLAIFYTAYKAEVKKSTLKVMIKNYEKFIELT